MGAVRNQLKVFYPVIEGVKVFVMNMLGAKKLAAKSLFHYMPMFVFPAISARADLDHSIRFDPAFCQAR
jgi:hypothetical protein